MMLLMFLRVKNGDAVPKIYNKAGIVTRTKTPWYYTTTIPA